MCEQSGTQPLGFAASGSEMENHQSGFLILFTYYDLKFIGDFVSVVGILHVFISIHMII